MVDTERKKDNLLLTPKIKISILDNGMYGDSGRKEGRKKEVEELKTDKLVVWTFGGQSTVFQLRSSLCIGFLASFHWCNYV